MKIEMSITPLRAKRDHNQDGIVFRCSASRPDWTLVLTSKVSNIFPLTYLFCYLGMLSLPTNLTALSLGFRWKYVRDFSSLLLRLNENKKPVACTNTSYRWV